MQTSRSIRSSIPQPFRVFVWLLLWTRERVGAVVGEAARRHRQALDVFTAVLLTMLVTAVASLGINPVLTVGAGVGVAVLFVIAHSYVLAYEHDRV